MMNSHAAFTNFNPRKRPPPKLVRNISTVPKKNVLCYWGLIVLTIIESWLLYQWFSTYLSWPCPPKKGLKHKYERPMQLWMSVYQQSQPYFPPLSEKPVSHLSMEWWRFRQSRPTMMGKSKLPPLHYQQIFWLPIVETSQSHRFPQSWWWYQPNRASTRCVWTYLQTWGQTWTFT